MASNRLQRYTSLSRMSKEILNMISTLKVVLLNGKTTGHCSIKTCNFFAVLTVSFTSQMDFWTAREGGLLQVSSITTLLGMRKCTRIQVILFLRHSNLSMSQLKTSIVVSFIKIGSFRCLKAGRFSVETASSAVIKRYFTSKVTQIKLKQDPFKLEYNMKVHLGSSLSSKSKNIGCDLLET